MDISVLGPLGVEVEVEVEVEGGVDADTSQRILGPRDRMVLGALVLRRPGASAPDVLADALWHDRPPASWNKVVQGCIVRLRRLLGADAIETTTQGYRLTVGDDEVDADRFERRVRRGRELLALGEFDRAVFAFAEAMDGWRGAPYAELESWEPAVIEAARLSEMHLDAEELAVEAALRAGRHREVLADAQVRVAQQPMREHRWALLARAEYQSGRQAEALRTLRRARATLMAEAGLDPTAELVDLEADILAQDPALMATGAVAGPSAECPYRGLEPYGLDDSDCFFGREHIVAECMGTLAAHGVLALVGPSGSGKSSVAAAGIAPALLRTGHDVHIITPGPAPFAAVPAADRTTTSPNPDGHRVLVVDQCEEVFIASDLAASTAFFDAVTALAERQWVVIVLRADRLGDLARHAGMSGLVQRGIHMLGAMGESDIRATIEGPARQAGLLLEPGLVEILTREVAGEPGALPLLSHALRRTWECREGRVLTVDGYHEAGGLWGAVAQTAEDVYGGLSPDQRLAVRDLMRRLVAPTGEGEPLRCRVPRRLVASDDRHDVVIDRLVESRLVTTDGDSVTLAHEAIIRSWPRLRTWVDDDVSGQRVLRHLTLAADGWERMGRLDSELYRGVRLRTALEWRERAAPTLTPSEEAFLEAGRKASEHEAHETERRVRRQARVNRQLRLLLAAASALLLIALAAGVLALLAAGRARTEAAATEAARGLALAAAAVEVQPDDLSLSLLLAVEADRLDRGPATMRGLLSGLFAPAFSRTSIPTGAADYLALAFDPVHDVAVGKRADGRLDIVDLTARTVVHGGLSGPASPLEGVDIDPSGTWVVSAGVTDGDAAVVVYDISTGERVVDFPGEAGQYYWAEFSPNGEDLAIGGGGGVVTIRRTSDWSRRTTLDTGTGAPVSTLRYDRTGNRLFVATFDEFESEPAELTSFDAESGELAVPSVQTDEVIISSIVEIPDAGEIAVAGREVTRHRVDDLRSVGDPFGTILVEGLATLAISPDGSLALGSPVELHVFDSATDPDRTSVSFDYGASGAAFDGDGSSLITAGIDGSISLWAMAPVHDLGVPLEPAGPGLVSMSPGGEALAVWGQGRGVQFYDEDSRGHLGALPIESDISFTGVAFSQDGSELATLTCPIGVDPCPATLRVWDVATGDLVGGPIDAGDVWAFADNGVVYTDGDQHVATIGMGVVNVWDLATGEADVLDLEAARMTSLPSQAVYSVAAGAVDGRTLLAAQDEIGQAVEWELTSGRAEPVAGMEHGMRVAFSPDGRLVTAAAPGPFVLRDPFDLQPVSPVFPAMVPASSLQFSSTGLVVASGDMGTQLFDVATAQPASGVIPAWRSVLSPDGMTLYMGSAAEGSPAAGTGVVRALSLDVDDLLAEACRRAGRNFTRSEWTRLMGTEEAYRATCPQWPVPESSR